MKFHSLSEIIQNVRHLPPLHSRIDEIRMTETDLDKLQSEKRIVPLNRVESFGRSLEGALVPVYHNEELEKFPYSGQGEEIERLAWYSSFHYGEMGWGIYILRSGVYKVANSLIKNGMDRSVALATAQEVLIRHELTHFQTDLGITSIELSIGSSLYVDLYRHLRIRDPWHYAEEGLANALARAAIKSKPKNAFDQFLNSSPAGYSDWSRHTPKRVSESWVEVIRELLQYAPMHLPYPILAAETSNLVAPKYFDQVPVYEVYDLENGNLDGAYLMGPINEIQETIEFQNDLRKLSKGQPSYLKKWSGVKQKLSSGNIVGVHLELINKKNRVYSVRIDGEARAGLNCDHSLWSAIAAGHHDELYRRLNK
jgi:hypothetical protein